MQELTKRRALPRQAAQLDDRLALQAVAVELLLLGREGLAKLVLEVAKQICDSSNYIEVICGAGRIAAIVQACKYDGYWDEKAELGKQSGESLLYYLN